MLVLGAVGLWQAYKLFRGQSKLHVNQFVGLEENKMKSASTQLGWVFLLMGLWFLASVVLVILLRVPLSSFVGFFAVGIGIHYIGVRNIERKHGLKHS
jgi:hypothetical protein